jgi:hypothetical protein
MSEVLPLKAKQYVDPSSATRSLRNLCDAVDSGSIDVSALLAYAKLAGKRETPRFRITSPLPNSMLKAIRGLDLTDARKRVYLGVSEGVWTWDDAGNFENNATALSETHKKASQNSSAGVYRTRNRTPRSRTLNVGGMFTAKVSIEALSRPGLSDGARQCLILLVGLASSDDTLTTYTSSLATMMDRTSRTIRNYYAALEEAGLITRRPATHYNTVHITLHPDCRPSKYEDPRDVRAFKLARKSTNPALHLMAMSVVIASVDAHTDAFTTLDRRKEVSVFNQESNSLMQRLTNVHPAKAAPPPVSPIGRSGLSSPTTHSTLLLDPKRPINGEKRPRAWEWARTTGFNHLGAR